MSAINTQLAPIVLFVYNRPEHTRKTLEALASNELAEQSRLYIYADAPKADATSDDKEANETVKKFITEFQWPGSKQIIERTENWGLARNIVNGVTDIIDQFGKIIVLEDDLVTSRGFLNYMNNALTFYEDVDEVMHVTGHMHPLPYKLHETFFYRVPGSWGWGTWKSSWCNYEPDASKLLQKLHSENLLGKFSFSQSANFTQQLKQNVEGTMNTWAVKWYASVLLNNGLCLHPGRSLVRNIGHDSTGEHCGNVMRYQKQSIYEKVEISDISLKESKYVALLMKIFYKNSGNVKMKNILKNALFEWL